MSGHQSVPAASKLLGTIQVPPKLKTRDVCSGVFIKPYGFPPSGAKSRKVVGLQHSARRIENVFALAWA